MLRFLNGLNEDYRHFIYIINLVDEHLGDSRANKRPILEVQVESCCLQGETTTQDLKVV